MTLPYVRDVNYLSPSSLVMLEKEPVNFYFQRLGPIEFAPPRDPQTLPLAAGISFDAHVKVMVSKARKLPCQSLGYLLKDVVFERAASVKLGSSLAEMYDRSGALKALMGDKPSQLAITLEDFAPGTNVPLQGKLDAVLRNCVPHDWKLRGAARPGEYSPSPGYERLWPKHKDHKKAGLPLEEIDEDWATQLAIYGWLLGNSSKKDMHTSIDQVLVEEGSVRVAQYRKIVTATYQKALLKRLVDAWARIQEEAVCDGDLETLRAIR